jgi:hypothetical protein
MDASLCGVKGCEPLGGRKKFFKLNGSGPIAEIPGLSITRLLAGSDRLQQVVQSVLGDAGLAVSVRLAWETACHAPSNLRLMQPVQKRRVSETIDRLVGDTMVFICELCERSCDNLLAAPGIRNSVV